RGVQPAARRPGGHRADRSRRVAVAQPHRRSRRDRHRSLRPRVGVPMTPRTRVGRPAGTAGWPVPAALVALSALPLTAGTLRLIQLAGGPAVMPADQRFAGFPTALVVHIVGATLYALVGAFQFVPQLRRRHLDWHRRAGRVVAVAGLLVAGSALW